MSAKQPTPAQILQYYETLLTQTLPKYSMTTNIAALLKQFPGKEHQVYAQICKKCGVEPKPKPTPQDILDYLSRSKSASPKGNSVSQWLTAQGFAKYAKVPWFSDMKWERFLTITGTQLREFGVSQSDEQRLLELIAAEAGARKELDQAAPSEPNVKSDFVVGENCFTKVCSEGEKGKDDNESSEKWLNARISKVNDDNTFDIFVYNSDAHGVPSEAVDVPRNMLRKSTDHVQVAVPEPKKSVDKPRFKQGDRVRVFGLRSHTSYNGMYGKVLLHIPSERRYQVQLDTYDVIAIRQRNVAPASVGDSYEVAVNSAKEKMQKNNGKADEQALSNLILKLMENNPNTAPEKVGAFAVGYLTAIGNMQKDE